MNFNTNRLARLAGLLTEGAEKEEEDAVSEAEETNEAGNINLTKKGNLDKVTNMTDSELQGYFSAMLDFLEGPVNVPLKLRAAKNELILRGLLPKGA
jgi:hypothetical protein